MLLPFSYCPASISVQHQRIWDIFLVFSFPFWEKTHWISPSRQQPQAGQGLGIQLMQQFWIQVQVAVPGPEQKHISRTPQFLDLLRYYTRFRYYTRPSFSAKYSGVIQQQKGGVPWLLWAWSKTSFVKGFFPFSVTFSRSSNLLLISKLLLPLHWLRQPVYDTALYDHTRK